MNPSLDNYVNAFRKATDYIDATVMHQRAPLRERTMFTQAGRTIVHSQGERIIYGPNGAMIARVTEDDGSHNTHIEEDERLHAIVRPTVIRARGRLAPPAAMAGARVRPVPIRTAVIPKGPR
jgi:hypothetical protein